MTFKEFVEQEEVAAEDMGFGQEERSTFLHYLLLRLAYRARATEEILEMVKLSLDILVDKQLGPDTVDFEDDIDG